jgi:hypothetical protein
MHATMEELSEAVFSVPGGCVFKSERLNANIKPTLPKALISLVMTYASPAWVLAAELLKLQRL